MTALATVAQLAQFDEIIDVRTPPEFAEDHLPGAVNFPVLTAEERALVGTLYKQESSFAAKKLGAALIARNIARHIDEYFSSKPKHWRPLIYCWRGGKRSGAMAHILSEIGWKVARLEGGYKAYRRQVVEDLAILPQRFDFQVVCGPTGSGKSRLLQALAQAGAQVLDLEQLALHRGSVLGNLPDAPQPAQKMFESQIHAQLQRFDPAQPVYVEAESKKIGQLRVPDALIERMWQEGRCIVVQVASEQRVQLLREEYAHFIANPQSLLEKIDCLKALHSKERLEHWRTLIQTARWDEFVLDMLVNHYDPAYHRSTLKHYPQLGRAEHIQAPDISSHGFLQLARQLLGLKP
jgi:tRNA 2-selenouridine synthase